MKNRSGPGGEAFCIMRSLESRTTKRTVFTSAEREVKVSRRSGMYQSYNFSPRLGMQSCRFSVLFGYLMK